MRAAIAVIGEALIDRVRAGDGRVVAEVPGGSLLNVAVGIARLGHPVSLATRFGDDAHGALIDRHLGASGVAVMPDSRHQGVTSTATATLHESGSAEYTFEIRWDLQSVEPGPYTHVHVGSIAVVQEPGARVLRDAVIRERALGASISYDPNIRPALMGDRAGAVTKVESMIALAHLVKASEEDVEWLYPDKSLEWVEDHWLGLGPDMVVLTLGSKGATARTRSIRVQRSAQPTEVVDTIGAGDSFMSGFLHSLLSGGLLGEAGISSWQTLQSADLDQLVEPALECAAITVSRQGANPPRIDELRTR